MNSPSCCARPKIVRDHFDALDRLVEALVAHETIDGAAS
jgi:hypothetical protein